MKAAKPVGVKGVQKLSTHFLVLEALHKGVDRLPVPSADALRQARALCRVVLGSLVHHSVSTPAAWKSKRVLNSRSQLIH